MAMVIFTALNGLGVVFLLYVFVQFWKEGHWPKKAGTWRHAIEFPQKHKQKAVVVTHPISGGLQVEPASVSHSARAGLSVVPLQVRGRSLQGKEVHRDSADGTGETPIKRFPTR
jgi:hypothetical protein